MLCSPVNATSLPKSAVSDGDELVRGDPGTYPPNWICSLVITDTDGNQYYGSGFKIHIPNINRFIVVTSGHCVYINGAYADKITVTFPGQAAVTATQTDLYASPEFISYQSNDHDYGIIILPGNSDEGFGWSAIVPDDELSGHIVTCQWITEREISKVSPNRLSYTNDTMSDPSGSPVLTWYKGYWTVVGIHSRGSLNSAPRVTSEMIRRLLDRTQSLKKYSLQSLAFPNVYIHCDGRGIDAPVDGGAGIINCRFMNPSGPWEAFYMYPVEVTPSLSQEQTYIVVLQNYQWPNILVRLDGSDMTQFNGHEGGGVVNCQWSGKPTGLWESFFLEKDSSANGSPCYSFRSVKYPNCYIRLDGNGVTPDERKGGGTVNCQYYDTGTEPRTFELFFVEPSLDYQQLESYN